MPSPATLIAPVRHLSPVPDTPEKLKGFVGGQNVVITVEQPYQPHAQSEALLRLEESVKSADLAAIDNAIKDCDKMGLGDEEMVLAARDSKKKISKQNKVAAALEDLEPQQV